MANSAASVSAVPVMPAEFIVHAEKVLKGHRRERLILVGDLTPFFGLHGLMQSVAPPPARHQTTRKLVDDDDLAILHDIVDVPFIERIGLQGFHHVMDHIHVGRVVQIVDAEQFFDARIAVFGQRSGLGLFLDRVVVQAFELGNDRIDPVIEVGGLVGRAWK